MKLRNLVLTIFFAAAAALPAAAANTVAIDPGHQGEWVNMSDTEPVAPGSSEMKAKASTGTTGRFSGVPEYQLNLDISLKLRDELLKRGYEVILTREDNDKAISNSERALMAADQGGDVYVRIHANGSDDPSVNGALAMTMSPGNPYVGSLYEKSYELAGDILNAYCAGTGFANLGIQYYDNMTGINWSKIPVMILEMGFMTNQSDDMAMQDPSMQERMVKGIADGLDTWFAVNGEPQSKPDETGSAETGTEGTEPAGTEKETDPWQDIGVQGRLGSKAGSAVSAEKDEAAGGEETLITTPGMSGMLYEQYLLTREMMGEKWAVGFMVPDRAAVPDQTEDLTESLTEDTAELKTKPEQETEEKEKVTEKVTEAETNSSKQSGPQITGEENFWMINGDEVMQSASVIKLFIMGCVYDRICYPSSPETEIPYTESNPGELRSLLESMITVSSNEASNTLIDILGQGDSEAGKKAVNDFCEAHGYKGVHLGRKFLESNPTDDNYLTADACVKFLRDIYLGKLINEEASAKMLTILKGQTVKNKIPSGLPAGYASANKTGEMPEGYGLGCIENDVAIIWPTAGDPYILVALSNELGGRNNEAAEIIRQISSFVAEHAAKQ